ncbi:MAG: ABC transporter substrate-binding protein [Granulosicoccaceae bacterium]
MIPAFNNSFNNVVKHCIASLAMLCASFVAMAAEHPAQVMVVESTTQMMGFLKTDVDKIKADPAYLAAKVDELVVPHLDFNRMTRLAVGKNWKKASKEQKKDLVAEFKDLLLNTYTNALTEYSGETIKFEPYRQIDKEGYAVVRSVFNQAGGGAVPVLYKLRGKGGWKIYDIEVNSVSLVTSYRTAFGTEVSKGGIDGLLGTLKKKNAESK